MTGIKEEEEEEGPRKEGGQPTLIRGDFYREKNRQIVRKNGQGGVEGSKIALKN